MAVESLSILLDPKGKALLGELDKGIIENIQEGTISYLLKNKELSGTPEKGATLKARRFANAKSEEYGTARAAGKGKNVTQLDVDVNIDTDREFVEEIEQKDINLSGVEGLLTRRSANHQLRMTAELDTAFFAEAADAGTVFTPKSGVTEPWKKLDSAIVTLSTLKTDYVDGVPKSMMFVVASAEFYAEIREHLDHISNSGITIKDAEFGKFHGVDVMSSVNVPEGVEFILMVKGSVAQPLLAHRYNAERIGLSEAVAVTLFYYYGTKATTPELIFVMNSEDTDDSEKDDSGKDDENGEESGSENQQQ